MQAGVNGLLRDKTRPSRKPPLDRAVIARVVELTGASRPAARRPTERRRRWPRPLLGDPRGRGPGHQRP
jgi:hypothetical protein